jgi:hypothetical protein
MEDVIDLIATDASPSDISDRIKEVLFAKAAERVDSLRPVVASAMFGENESSEEESEEE